MNTLKELYLSHTGKVTSKFLHHIETYGELFEKFRDKSPTVVEIGIGAGGFIYVLRKYFGDSARLCGIDVVPGGQDRISACNGEYYWGNQGDDKFLKETAEKIKPIDIIIDDGSHENPHQISTFETLFPYLSDGGIYAIEDIHTSYRWTHHGGSRLPTTFVEFLKLNVDYMHITDFTPEPQGVVIPKNANQIKSITFYRSLVVIEKSLKVSSIGSPLLIGKEGL